MNGEIYKQPILSICIPIYNRLSYLEKMLSRFMEDVDLFKNEIHLFIADNCSQDDLGSCCNKYQSMGLNISYQRNKENIGPDRNFELCFHNGRGKYTWLLGSDDIPVSGFLRKLIPQLKQNDYGLFHLSMKPRKEELAEYHYNDEMAVAVNYWITLMSANIIRTDYISDVNFSDYRQSNMIQVPAYLNACSVSDVSAISYLGHPFEIDTDAGNNGGYNLFKVFVTNLFSIYELFVEKELLSRAAFNDIKKIEFKEFLSGYVVRLLIFKTNKNFDTSNGWNILKQYYGHSIYVCPYLLRALFLFICSKIKTVLVSLIKYRCR